MGENRRDRARVTEAFRRWARAGCPVGDKIRETGDDTEKDFRACAAVFDVLGRRIGRDNAAFAEIRRAVEEVYMQEPQRKLRKMEVTLRVRRVALETYVSERQVYAWLARARALWWRYRE